MKKHISLPLSEKDILDLKAGDYVYLDGIIFSARDAAHNRMQESIPFDIQNQTIYYLGPSPAREGNVIGSAGPTTSSRMDKYTPRLLDLGLRGMIGKGKRSKEVIEAIIRNKAVYFAAVGGA
jgi:fumarate hydratase subunit beta